MTFPDQIKGVVLNTWYFIECFHLVYKCLLLVSTAASATTSTLELPTLGADIGLSVAVGNTRSRAKVLDSLTGITASYRRMILIKNTSTSHNKS
jgi:hypothetical protein